MFGGFRITRTTRIFSRSYKILAIESSCDDSCVALLDRPSPHQPTIVLEHVKSSLNSIEHGGIIPKEAHLHHQANISPLVKSVLKKHNLDNNNPPDLICVTRGPGMTGSLSMGLEVAKGLSIAWNKPLIGVHHMLGHLLIPRLQSNAMQPKFPFLSLLVSGGHTMLVLSKSLTEHENIIDTDIACGDALDKCARELGMKGIMLGKELETFVNQQPKDWDDDLGFKIPLPLANKRGRTNLLAFSFTAYNSVIKQRLHSRYPNTPIEEVDEHFKRALAFKLQESMFDHLIDKIKLAVSQRGEEFKDVQHLVLSGGVASNSRLREKLDKELKERFSFEFPSPSLCTDNAIMIGHAGIEIYETLKLQTDVSARAIRKWPLDDILNVPDWSPLESS